MTRYMPLMFFTFLALFVVTPVFGDCKGNPQGEALVVYEQIPLHQNRDLASEETRRLPFGTGLRWYQDNREFGTVLVGGNGFCGWVDSKKIKRGPPLRVSELFERARDSEDDNPLFAKVIITNQARVRTGVRGEQAEQVVVRKAPRLAAQQVRELGLYELFLVWDKRKDDQGNVWYLLGASQDPLPDYLLGWVQRQDTIVWPHREAVFPRQGRSLEIYSNDQMSPPPMLTLQAVDERERGRAVNKLPLLDRRPASRRAHRRERNAVATITQRMERRLIRQACQGMTPAQCADLVGAARTRLASAIRSADSVDILVVMDNTESMVRYRQPVLDGLREGLSAYLHTGIRARFAFAFYGDYFEQEDGWGWVEDNAQRLEPVMRNSVPNQIPLQLKLWNFADSGELPGRRDLAGVVGANSFDDPRNDLPEAPLAALATAIKGATWGNTKFRLVLWIGDDGNREVADPGGVGIDDVVRALQSKGAALVPINVKGDRDDHWNELFIKQAKAIRNKLVESGDNTTLAPFSVRNRDARQDQEMERLKEGVKLYTMSLFDVSLFIRAYQYGQVEGGHPVNSNALTPVINEPQNLSFARWQDAWLDRITGVQDARRFFREAARDTQMVRVGWVYGSSANGENSLNYYVALTEAELSGLTYSLDQLCRAIGGTDGVAREFRRSVEELVHVSIGEYNYERNLNLRQHLSFNPNEDLQQFYRRVLHLPERTFDLFEGYNFSRIIDELRNLDNPPEAPIAKAVCKSVKLLQLIQNSKYVESDWLEFSRVDNRRSRPIFRLRNSLNIDSFDRLDSFEWLWGLESGISYYFVPIDFLPHR